MEYRDDEILKLKRIFLDCAYQVCPTFKVPLDMKQTVSDIFDWCVRRRGSRLDINKGLWLSGDVGSGKSTLLRVVAAFGPIKIPFYHFRINSTTDVAAEFSKRGYEALDQYVNTRFQAFDDLGSEPLAANHYGTIANPMEYILTGRYEKRGNDFTHVTTNLSPEAVIQSYGERVYDRCREMFNFVKLEGASWR